MTATRYTRMAKAMKTGKTNGVLLRNRQIHSIVLWSLWFVAVIVKPVIHSSTLVSHPLSLSLAFNTVYQHVSQLT